MYNWGRDRLQLGRLESPRHPVQLLAPAPEIVDLALAALGQAGKSALERVAVRVDQPR